MNRRFNPYEARFLEGPKKAPRKAPRKAQARSCRRPSSALQSNGSRYLERGSKGSIDEWTTSAAGVRKDCPKDCPGRCFVDRRSRISLAEGCSKRADAARSSCSPLDNRYPDRPRATFPRQYARSRYSIRYTLATMRFAGFSVFGGGYRGGLTMLCIDDRRLHNSKRWKALRWRRLHLDGGMCVRRRRRNPIEIATEHDHIEPVITQRILIFEIGSKTLKSLCRQCRRSKARGDHRSLFEELPVPESGRGGVGEGSRS